MRGAVTHALHRHLTKHTESPMEAAAHLQLEAVRRALTQGFVCGLPYCERG